MRILVVSAHFPPNFVSGGTLAPQRQATGLRAAGHEVSVYAGWQGPGPAALDSWEERDGGGLGVRWVVTTPWTDWDQRGNFDNPAVARHFAAHVAAVRPDVVHLHSLQSMGAGVVEGAVRGGARVVLTMHDAWWWCGRQFLATREHRPCSPVVSCGACPCQVDRAWLAERNRFLARRLALVDLVLATSEVAAGLVRANGAPPGRVEVDENGVPPAAEAAAAGAAAAQAAPGGAVRFLYTGGPDRMKGAHVLVDAARLLGDLGGWRLVAHGLGPFLAGPGAPAVGPAVDVRPPFGPGEVDAVFAGADVLVVPSVARESYSLVTREALTRGVPVVCTDSLGPEEAVHHGVNGLVVPSGDAGALAGALASLVGDPALLDRLRGGCGAVRVRPLADQVRGLVRRYERLVGGGGRPVADDGGRRVAGRRVGRVVFLAGIDGAPLRYRARLPAEALGLLGVQAEVRHYRDPDLPRLTAGADVVVAYRVPATVQVLDLLGACRARGTPVLCDYDDLIFEPAVVGEVPALALLDEAERALWVQGVHRYRTTMECCDAFVGSTAELCRRAEQVGLPAARFANGVGLRLARAADAALARPRLPGPPRIGYLSGTATHDRDWLAVEPAVAAVLDRRPDVELWLAGLVNPSAALDRFGPRVRRLPMVPWLKLPVVLRNLDVNLAPLEPASAFNEAKSAIKWLEAALTATPTVAAGTGPFREAVRHGTNGLVAEGPDEWEACIEGLLADVAGRAAMGGRARRDALLGWSPHVQGPRYLDLLRRAEPRTTPLARPTDPVAHDEPPTPVALEPYGPPA